MKKNTDLLVPETFYHVYNRGINGENLFKEERNYLFFLQKLAIYILPIAEIYAYCLMKNHFHLCICTRSANDILLNCVKDTPISDSIKSKSPEWYIGNQFASLFKSYAQAINKGYNRHGQLFEEVFRRIALGNDGMLNWVIFYIHANPQLHGFMEDFSTYNYSSYSSLLSTKSTQLSREKVLEVFDGKIAFQRFHLGQFSDDIISAIGL